MFDLSKWENDHPAVRRFAQQVADVLESVAEHLIGQASAAVNDALADTPTTTSGNALSAPQSVSEPLEDPAPENVAQAPAQPAGETTPGALAAARALVDEGYTPEHAAAVAGVDVVELRAPEDAGEALARQAADALVAQGWDPQRAAALVGLDTGARGVAPSPVTDSGPAGVVAGAGQDVPVTGAPAGAPVPGSDIPVTHNVDPADVVGADSHNGPGQ